MYASAYGGVLEGRMLSGWVGWGGSTAMNVSFYFLFIKDMSNTSDVDLIILLTLSTLNVKHMKTGAVGQPSCAGDAQKIFAISILGMLLYFRHSSR